MDRRKSSEIAKDVAFGKGAKGAWPRAVIFDLDGTLVDTAEDIATALNALMAEMGLPPHPIEQVRLMVGGGLGKLLERALAAQRVGLNEEQWAGAVDRLYVLYAQRPVEKSTLYPGAVALLQHLAAAEIACAICTNKPQSICEDVLKGLGVADAFAYVQGADSGFPKKPDPTALKHVMQMLNVSPGETVMVGDSNTDVEVARAADLAGVILVNHGYTQLPASELGGDIVIEELSDLPQSLVLLAERD